MNKRYYGRFSEESPPFLREVPGMLIFFAVTMGSLMLAHHFEDAVMDHFRLHGGSPGDEPPWYFITRDFAQGICSLGALVLSLSIAAIIWRWWPVYAGMMTWMSLIWHGGKAAQAWIIHQGCPGLLEGQRTTTRWPTFDSYLNDPDIERARSVVLVAGMLAAFVLPVLVRRFRRKAAMKASTPS